MDYRCPSCMRAMGRSSEERAPRRSLGDDLRSVCSIYGLAECLLLLRFRYEDNPLTAFIALRFPNAAKFVERAANGLVVDPKSYA
jgi:hypothetical protein